MPKTSIQRRLIAVVVISQLVLALGLVVVAVYFTRRQLRNAFDAQLRGRAMSIAALVRYSEDPHPKLIFEDDLVPPPLEREHPDLYQVIGQRWPGDRTLCRTGRRACSLCRRKTVSTPDFLTRRRAAIARCVWRICRCWTARPTRLPPTAHRHLCRAHQPR